MGAIQEQLSPKEWSDYRLSAVGIHVNTVLQMVMISVFFMGFEWWSLAVSYILVIVVLMGVIHKSRAIIKGYFCFSVGFYFVCLVVLCIEIYHKSWFILLWNSLGLFGLAFGIRCSHIHIHCLNTAFDRQFRGIQIVATNHEIDCGSSFQKKTVLPEYAPLRVLAVQNSEVLPNGYVLLPDYASSI